MVSYSQLYKEDIEDSRATMEVFDSLPKSLRRAFSKCRYGYSLQVMLDVREDWVTMGGDKAATERVLRKLRTRERFIANNGTGA